MGARNRTMRQWGRSRIHGYGVFALRFIPKGAKIHMPDVGMDHGFNHSHDPNVANRGEWHLKALKDIPAGAELVTFYHGAVAEGLLTQANCRCPVCHKARP